MGANVTPRPVWPPRGRDPAAGYTARPAAHGTDALGVRPVVQTVASSHGGGAVYVRTLAIGLSQRGLSVAVAMPLDGGQVVPQDFTTAGVRFAAWTTAPSWRAVSGLARMLRSEGPGLVHAHGSRAAVLTWAALWLAGLPDVRLLCSVHGLVTPFHRQPRRALQALLERAVGRRCAGVVAVSESERAAVLAAGMAPACKLVTVRPGIDVTAFTAIEANARSAARRALGIAAGAFTILTVCRLDRPRDFETLLAALRLVVDSHPNTQLLIVGDGPQRGAVDARVRDLRLEGHVTRFGLQREVVPYFAAADAFVLTSSGWEAFGIATVEAQAAGLPVIVTDAGGAAEACRPGVSAFLVPCRAPAALARALLELASDPVRRARMGAAGRTFAGTHFHVDAMADAILCAYRKVMDGGTL